MSNILLVGCGKSKRTTREAAANLYTGGLFTARRKFAEATELPWLIISAKYGLIWPGTMIDPYDLTIKELSVLDRAAWGLDVVHKILDELTDSQIKTTRDLREVVLEVHAGADYAEAIRDIAIAAGLNFAWPVKGLSQGEQMHYYKTTSPQGRRY